MQRIIEHPVLGPLPEVPMVKIIVDGEQMEAREGEMIAAALIATGKKYFRKTIKTHEPRGIYCGIGRCTDCVMTVNGIPNVRTCITPVEEGMVIETQMGYGVWKQEQ
ncbi:MAG: (2Fe-2S)-binding protein [Sphaerochaeta sp.]|jgi:predicted molibdopterin-dependent oxidoreductase YjgC|nr:(2Fe-2S)-binding protein [Sphaerochaeta sp.]PKL28959.1 MAG: dehydrogenase [Spirochaetae bacterium HGW-Spirochaetae-2]